ncbi:hypothetical protein AURDEDRAFT_172385 [Auricularia subglabra TFB-10046 SS5]|nr:hypothetical protein AURDEDRAFT_172385 [Auricularia subglabra TFB-10046 SS5]
MRRGKLRFRHRHSANASLPSTTTLPHLSAATVTFQVSSFLFTLIFSCSPLTATPALLRPWRHAAQPVPGLHGSRSSPRPDDTGRLSTLDADMHDATPRRLQGAPADGARQRSSPPSSGRRSGVGSSSPALRCSSSPPLARCWQHVIIASRSRSVQSASMSGCIVEDVLPIIHQHLLEVFQGNGYVYRRSAAAARPVVADLSVADPTSLAVAGRGGIGLSHRPDCADAEHTPTDVG